MDRDRDSTLLPLLLWLLLLSFLQPHTLWAWTSPYALECPFRGPWLRALDFLPSLPLDRAYAFDVLRRIFALGQQAGLMAAPFAASLR